MVLTVTECNFITLYCNWLFWWNFCTGPGGKCRKSDPANWPSRRRRQTTSSFRYCFWRMGCTAILLKVTLRMQQASFVFKYMVASHTTHLCPAPSTPMLPTPSIKFTPSCELFIGNINITNCLLSTRTAQPSRKILNLWSDDLIVRVLDSQSRGSWFKSTRWLQDQLSLSSFRGRSSIYS